jgi:hypothetical protein
LHGGIFADLIEDGTRSVIIGGVLATLNIVFKERREAQRTIQVEAYASLVQIRERALAAGSDFVGVVPLGYISDRIRHFEESSSLKAINRHRRSSESRGAEPTALYSTLDTVFAIVMPVLPVLLSAIIIVATSLDLSKVTPIALTVVLVPFDIWVLHRIRSWTARSLENAFVRHVSQVLIGLSAGFVAVLPALSAFGFALQAVR